MEIGTALFIVVAATAVFLFAIVFLLRRFKKANAGKYAPAIKGKGFDVRRPPKGERPPK